MATVAVYPREGTTYPDAAGVPITSAGAIVEVSKYIKDAIRAGFLLSYDPLSVYQPDDRTDTGGGGGGGGGSALSFELIADMVERVGEFDGQVCTVLGYNVKGDGGGGDFYWSQGEAGASDGGLIFGASPSGKWCRIWNYPIHARWFGAWGDGTHDDTEALQAWIDSVTWGKVGFSDPGVYKITAPLYIVENHATFEGTQSTVALDTTTKGFGLMWHGADTWFTGEDWAVYVTGLSTMIRGWNIQAATRLYGGFHVGEMDFSIGRNTRCSFVDCTVHAGEDVGDPIINYGFGVGQHWQSVGKSNMDFNVFENCMARNCFLWGWVIHGGANTIQTTLRRCAAVNTMGVPGKRMYVATGQSDGDIHCYGGGVLAWENAGVDMDGINFAYLETGFMRSNPITLGNSYATNDRLVNFDCELTKKLIRVRMSGTNGTVVLENGRFAHPRLWQEGLGPCEWPADDYRHIDLDGCISRISGMSYAIDDDAKYDDCVYLGAYGGILENCALPSNIPFVGEVTTYACHGAVGDGTGIYEKIADGTFTWRPDGTIAPPPAAIASKYIAALGSKLCEFWTADYGVEVNTAGEVLGWTGAVKGTRLAPATSGNRPTFATDGSNFRGKPVVHTAETGTKGLYGEAPGAGAPVVPNAKNVWSISVCRIKTVPGAGVDQRWTIFDGGHNLSNDLHFLEYERISGTTALHYQMNSGIGTGANLVGPTPDANQHVYVCYTNGSQSRIDIDGSNAASTANTAVVNSGIWGFAIGRRAGQNINGSDVAHAMHLICSAPPTSGELTTLMQLIASDWSIA